MSKAPNKEEIELILQRMRKAAVAAGLDIGAVVAEVVDRRDMAAIGAQIGYPNMPKHYLTGQEFIVQEGLYAGGQAGTTYEMVINNEPAVAYLLAGNDQAAQELVLAHIMGHIDFFRSSAAFANTRRDSIDMFNKHTAVAEEMTLKHGQNLVEEWIDICLTLSPLIDTLATHRPDLVDAEAPEDNTRELRFTRKDMLATPRFNTGHEEIDEALETPDWVTKKQQEQTKERLRQMKFPVDRVYDIVGFLAKHGKITQWQREMLLMYRQREYYFLPQKYTKYLNEGWAVFWHTRLMAEHGSHDSMVSYASLHSGVTSSRDPLNPYFLGWQIIEHVYDKICRSHYDPEYLNIEDEVEKRAWGKMVPQDAMRRLRDEVMSHTDATFFDKFIDEDFVRKHELFIWGADKRDSTPKGIPVKVITKKVEELRASIVQRMIIRGTPRFFISNANYRNRGELLVEQDLEFCDRPVEKDSVEKMGMVMAVVWGRPVAIIYVTKNGTEELVFDEKTLKQGTPLGVQMLEALGG